MVYLYLALAIVSEVIGTSALKASDGFTKLIPSIVVVLGYGAAFYLLSVVLQTIPVGVTYAVWSGVGIVLVAVVAAIMYKQIPDLAAMAGMGMIIAGVAVINLFSKTAGH